MRNIANFNLGSRRIRNSALSSQAAGGIRKVRVAVGSRAKSGGARIIYYWAVRRSVILLLYAYPKNVAADLTSKQISKLAKVVKEEFGK
jgi:mRNA-degrading endonuclease RelE of RelBE toxin-antitoxin system